MSASSIPSTPPSIPLDKLPKKKRKRNRQRSRPHKKDFAFPQSYPHTQKKTGPPITYVFALAMSWHRPRDRIRLQSLLNQRRGTKIITISDCNHSQGRMEHMSHDFKDRKALKTITEKIKMTRLGAPSSKILVILDYYFLQGRYYRERYGLDWLEGGAHRLLLAGADEMVLPFDNGWGHLKIGSDMADMLAGVQHPGTQIKFTSLEENLLWVATDSDEIR
jgi:hypothetical protein